MRVLVKRFTDNQSNFVLVRNREVMADISAITRVVITVGGVDYDSDVVPQYFDWTGTITYQKRITTEYIGIKLGLAGIPLGTYTGCSMKVYFQLNPAPVWVFDSAVVIVEDL